MIGNNVEKVYRLFFYITKVFPQGMLWCMNGSLVIFQTQNSWSESEIILMRGVVKYGVSQETVLGAIIF